MHLNAGCDCWNVYRQLLEVALAMQQLENQSKRLDIIKLRQQLALSNIRYADNLVEEGQDDYDNDTFEDEVSSEPVTSKEKLAAKAQPKSSSN